MGKAFCYGDHVDTDVIIPARYLTTDDAATLASHAMEDLDPAFASTVVGGDVVFAGDNFGCGSSREHAPIALRAAGASAVVARSFARIFFRNAINTGLPVLVCPEAVAATDPGDEVEVEAASGTVHNRSKGLSFRAEELPPFIVQIVEAGGLVAWVSKKMEVVS